MKWLRLPCVGKHGISRFLQSEHNIVLVRYLPKFISRAYVYILGYLFLGCNPRLKERIGKHIFAAFGQAPPDSHVKTLKLTLRGILAHYYEKLFVAFFNFKKVCRFLNHRVAVEEYALLDQALARGKGAILVTGHYGAVEFLPLTLALKGYPVTMLLRFKTRSLKESLIHRAQGTDIELVDVAEDRRVVFTALKALKANRILITECDEFERWCRDKRKTVSFLGASLLQDRSLDMLQRRSKAPVVMGLVQRQSSQHYQLRLHGLETASAHPRQPSIAQQALSILEAYIAAAPHQWYQWKEADFLLTDAADQSAGPDHETVPNRNLPFAHSFPITLPA